MCFCIHLPCSHTLQTPQPGLSFLSEVHTLADDSTWICTFVGLPGVQHVKQRTASGIMIRSSTTYLPLYLRPSVPLPPFLHLNAYRTQEIFIATPPRYKGTPLPAAYTPAHQWERVNRPQTKDNRMIDKVRLKSPIPSIR